jgi:hypothetical protein
MLHDGHTGTGNADTADALNASKEGASIEAAKTSPIPLSSVRGDSGGGALQLKAADAIENSMRSVYSNSDRDDGKYFNDDDDGEVVALNLKVKPR